MTADQAASEDRPAGAPALKAELRRRVLARRDALAVEVRREWSAAIFTKIAALESFREAGTVLVYSAFGSEPDTGPFLRTVLALGKSLALPRVDRAGHALALHRVRDPDLELRAGVWGIREPDPARCVPVSPGELGFILVPGVVFDVHGGRIGYGGGYYDRLLGALAGRPALVAAAFEVQIVEEVPMGPDDHRVDRVVTESRTYPA